MGETGEDRGGMQEDWWEGMGPGRTEGGLERIGRIGECLGGELGEGLAGLGGAMGHQAGVGGRGLSCHNA